MLKEHTELLWPINKNYRITAEILMYMIVGIRYIRFFFENMNARVICCNNNLRESSVRKNTISKIPAITAVTMCRSFWDKGKDGEEDSTKRPRCNKEMEGSVSEERTTEKEGGDGCAELPSSGDWHIVRQHKTYWEEDIQNYSWKVVEYPWKSFTYQNTVK